MQFVVPIYRLIVMQSFTTSLYSFGHGSQNNRGSKIAFYVCHVAPEFIVSATLMVLNVRQMFATGLWGDHRYRDPKPRV